MGEGQEGGLPYHANARTPKNPPRFHRHHRRYLHLNQLLPNQHRPSQGDKPNLPQPQLLRRLANPHLPLFPLEPRLRRHRNRLDFDQPTRFLPLVFFQ